MLLYTLIITENRGRENYVCYNLITYFTIFKQAIFQVTLKGLWLKTINFLLSSFMKKY